MADNSDLTSLSFGITDTIQSSSQQLIDSFLEGNVTTDPKDIKDINEPEPVKPVAKPKAVATPKKEEVPEQEEEPFDPLAELEEEIPSDTPVKKKEVPGNEGVVNEEEEEFNQFEAFSKGLFDLGAFSKEEGEEITIPKTGEEFLSLFNEQSGKRAESIISDFLSKFGDDYRDAFDNIFVNGVNPKDYYQTYNAIQNFSELDLSTENNQEKVVRQALTDLGYEEEDVASEIERLKNYGDLETAAGKHHKVLIKKEQQKLAQLKEQKQAQLEQQQSIKTQFATNVTNVLQDKLKTKDFDGIPITPQLAKDVQDMLLTEKWKTSSGEPLTDFDVEILNLKKPENHATKAKLALLLRILKDDPTLSSIRKSAITKTSNVLFDEVVRQKPSAAKQSQSSSSPAWTRL